MAETQDKQVAAAVKADADAQRKVEDAERRAVKAEAQLAALQAERATAAAAQPAADPADARPDETTPGGRFLVGGVYVDCDGKPLEK